MAKGSADNCVSEEQLAGYLMGTCPEEERAALEVHLRRCADCRAWAEQARADDSLLPNVRRVLEEDAARNHREILVAHEEESAHELSPRTGALDAIEGYDILRELGRGGMGVVYLAVQKSTKRKVALKVLLEGPFASTATMRRFEREVELAAHLEHPHIVTVLESGESEGRRYFAMQYVEGQRLDAYVRDRDLSIKERLGLFVKISRAVSYAHQRGVIHRDLKPSNLLIDDDGNPHILDFGLAKVSDPEAETDREQTHLTMTGQIMGTLPYMSPEQTSGSQRDIDVRSDVYSLGVILYEMLTGQFPYRVVGHLADVLRNIAEAEPRQPSQVHKRINDEVETIVLKALAKSRDRRYQSADTLATEVERYLTGQPIEAKRDSGWYVARKLLRRYRTGLTIAGVFAAVLILLATLAVRERARADREAASKVLADFVQRPNAAVPALSNLKPRIRARVADAAVRSVYSEVYLERVVGARSGVWVCPEAFWESVDGGPMWENGEWLELAEVDWDDPAPLLAELAGVARSGSDRQKYVAFCLIGQIGGADAALADLCAGAVGAESHPGVVAAARWAAQRLGREVSFLGGEAVFVDEHTGLVFVRVPGCEQFRRGSAPDDPDRLDDEDRPESGVDLAPLYFSTTEVTWAALDTFFQTAGAQAMCPPALLAKIREQAAGATKAELRRGAANWVSLPVARAYCDWVNETGAGAMPPRRYRLPTEDEWEHACRAGNAGRFCFGNDARYVRYFAKCNGVVREGRVGAERMPNWYGLFDTHGGLWEWCDSPYASRPRQKGTGTSLSSVVDLASVGALGASPLLQPENELYVLRGGAYYSPAVRCRSAQRNHATERADAAGPYIGLRLVMEVGAP